MWYASSRRVGPAVGVGLAAVIVCTAAGCLFRGGARGTIDQLVVLQYRYTTDEKHDIVRVFGHVKNTGDNRVPACEVLATLRSRSGAMKGENRVALPSLGGGETHDFSLAVTMHGSVADVDIRLVPEGYTPEPAQEEES